MEGSDDSSGAGDAGGDGGHRVWGVGVGRSGEGGVGVGAMSIAVRVDNGKRG